MISIVRVIVVLMWVLAIPLASAQTSSGAVEHKPIPFKQDPVSMGEQGWQTGLTLLGLLVVTAFVLVWLRRKVPGAIQRAAPGERIQVIDRLRLDTKTQVFVLHYQGRDVLLAQSGESLLELNGVVRPARTAQVEECCHVSP